MLCAVPECNRINCPRKRASVLKLTSSWPSSFILMLVGYRESEEEGEMGKRKQVDMKRKKNLFMNIHTHPVAHYREDLRCLDATE